MDIFAFAIQMEKEGEQFYRQLASKASNEGIQTILNMLADDEEKHACVIRTIQSEAAEMEPTTVLDSAKNIFRQMKEFGGKFDVNTEESDMYRQAMGIESKSIDFYLDRADEVKTPAQRQLFQRLADEEKKHYRLLESLADFVSRPDHWLENAEFFHTDDY